MHYERKDIRPGQFMTKNGGPCIEAPRAPRYGDNFSAVSARLDQVKARLEKLRDDFRAARQSKP